MWLGGFAPSEREAGSEQGSRWEEREDHREGCLLLDIGGYIRVTCLYLLKSNQARPPGAKPPPPGGEDLAEAPFPPGGPTPCENKGFPVAQLVKNLPAKQETWVLSLGWEDPMERGKAPHSSILAWRTPWTV